MARPIWNGVFSDVQSSFKIVVQWSKQRKKYGVYHMDESGNVVSGAEYSPRAVGLMVYRNRMRRHSVSVPPMLLLVIARYHVQQGRNNG